MLDRTVPVAYAAQWAGLGVVERIAALGVPVRDARLRLPVNGGAGGDRGW